MTHILRATYLSGRQHQQQHPRATVPPVFPSQGPGCGCSTASCCPYSLSTELVPISVMHPPSTHTCQLPQARHSEHTAEDGIPRGNVQGSQQALPCAGQMGFDTDAFCLLQPPSCLPLSTACSQEKWLVPGKQSMDLNSCTAATGRSRVINESLEAKPSQSRRYRTALGAGIQTGTGQDAHNTSPCLPSHAVHRVLHTHSSELDPTPLLHRMNSVPITIFKYQGLQLEASLEHIPIPHSGWD